MAVMVALALAAASLLAMTIAYLSGFRGLYPRVDGLFASPGGVYDLVSPRWAERVLGLVRFVVQRTLMLAAAGTSLAVLAMLADRPLPPWRRVASWLTAIVLTAGLVMLIALEPRWLEQVVELALQAIVFVATTKLLFRLRWTDAGILLAATVGLIAFAAMGARLVNWAF